MNKRIRINGKLYEAVDNSVAIEGVALGLSKVSDDINSYLDKAKKLGLDTDELKRILDDLNKYIDSID